MTPCDVTHPQNKADWPRQVEVEFKFLCWLRKNSEHQHKSDFTEQGSLSENFILIFKTFWEKSVEEKGKTFSTFKLLK